MPGKINASALETHGDRGIITCMSRCFPVVPVRGCRAPWRGCRGGEWRGRIVDPGFCRSSRSPGYQRVQRLAEQKQAAWVGSGARGKKTGQLEPGPGCIIVFAGFDEILQILFISTQMREWLALICARC